MASLKACLPRHVRTERLVLELFDFSPEHYECFLASMNTPTAHADMGDFGIRSPAQFDVLDRTTRLSRAVLGDRTADATMLYLLRLGQEFGPLMGAVSLAQRGPTLDPDMGWCLLEEYMGKGYAAEAGRELLRLWKDDLGISRIIAWPSSTNKRSIIVAEKIGLVKGGYVRDNEGKLQVVYLLPGMVFDPNMKISFWSEGDNNA